MSPLPSPARCPRGVPEAGSSRMVSASSARGCPRAGERGPCWHGGFALIGGLDGRGPVDRARPVADGGRRFADDERPAGAGRPICFGVFGAMGATVADRADRPDCRAATPRWWRRGRPADGADHAAANGPGLGLGLIGGRPGGAEDLGWVGEVAPAAGLSAADPFRRGVGAATAAPAPCRPRPLVPDLAVQFRGLRAVFFPATGARCGAVPWSPTRNRRPGDLAGAVLSTIGGLACSVVVARRGPQADELVTCPPVRRSGRARSAKQTGPPPLRAWRRPAGVVLGAARQGRPHGSAPARRPARTPSIPSAGRAALSSRE